MRENRFVVSLIKDRVNGLSRFVVYLIKEGVKGGKQICSISY